MTETFVLLLALAVAMLGRNVDAQYWSMITDPFMPPWPQGAPNGPVYRVAPFALPSGGGSLGIGSQNGHGFGLNNFQLLPVTKQNQSQAGSVLSVQDVTVTWTPRATPSNIVLTITPSSRFLVAGTNESEILALQDIYFNTTKPLGAPPAFTFARELFSSGTQRTTLATILGSAYAPSDFCDWNGDGVKDEIFVGGSTGKLALLRLAWDSSSGGTSPSVEQIISPTDTKLVFLNNLAIVSDQVFSKPSCASISTSKLVLAMGYRSGKIVAMSYDTTTQSFTMLQTVQIDPNKFVYIPALGTPPDNLFASPAWVDLDNDNLPDGLAVGFKNGAMNLLFANYTKTSTTCTAPTCALGFFTLGCDCRPCPAGTYRSLATQTWCRVCGGVDLFCPEGSQYPQTRNGTNNQCSYWGPYPSLANPSLSSPNFARDLTYYTDNYGVNGGAKVTLSDGTDVNVNSYWTAGNMQQEMFGGMRNWRNRVGSCGSVALPATYTSAAGTNSTYGYVQADPMVRPNVASQSFSLQNPGGTDVNVTFQFSSDAGYATVTDPTQANARISKTVLPANSQRDFFLRIETGSVPVAMLVNNRINVTLEMVPEQYWKQQLETGTETMPSIFITFQLELQDATFLVIPASFAIEAQTNTITTRTVQIFSLQEQPSTLNIQVVYISATTGWLSYQLQGNSTNLSVGPIAVCDPNPTCHPRDRDPSMFSRFMDVTFDSTNFLNGVYLGNIVVNGINIVCSLTVKGGQVDWRRSTLQYMDSANQLITIGTDPAYRVDYFPTISITARDSLGNPTDNYQTTQLKVEWAFSPQEDCPLPADQCSGAAGAGPTGTLGLFSSRFQLNAQGTYKITVKDPSDNLVASDVGTSSSLPNPIYLNISAKACTDANALPDGVGSQCLCKPGYGVDISSGLYGDVVCTECSKGTFSLGGGLPCTACADGTYQDGVGQTECMRCPSYITTPDSSKSSCVACNSIEYVREDDSTWTCKACLENQRVRVLRDSNGVILNFTHPTLPDVTINKYFCSCNANMFWSKILNKCVLCPTGGFCVDRDEDNLLPRQGYWGPLKDGTSTNVTSRRRMQSSNETFIMPEFFKCRRAESCAGIDILDSELGVDSILYERLASASLANITAEGCTQCEAGFTGPLCFKCAGGYTRAGVDSCTKCLNKGTVIFLLILGAFFAIVVCIYIIRRTLVNMQKESENQSEEMILLKLLMSHLQSESMAQGIDLDWPAFVLSMFDVFNLISSTGQSAFSLDCFVDDDINSGNADSCNVLTDNRLRTFFLSALFIALLPIFGFLCSSIFWMSRYVYIKRTTGKGRGRSFYQYNLVSLIIIVFLLYPSLVRTAFKFFSASSELIAGNRFLEADFNIVFGSKEHLVWALCLGIPMIFIYALGVPAGFFYILKTRRADSHRYGKVFTFLYTGFKPDRYYWECVIMIRKLGIAACTIMLKPYGPDIQAFATSMVVVLFLGIQLHVRPYILNTMNFVEFFGLTTIYLTLFLGLFQSSINVSFGSGSGLNVAFGVVIVLINASFLVFIFGKLLSVTYNVSKEKGWAHATLMIVSLGNIGSSTSKRDVDSSETRIKQAHSVVDADKSQESGNPVFTKEMRPSQSSAQPGYDDVYGAKKVNDKVQDDVQFVNRPASSQ